MELPKSKKDLYWLSKRFGATPTWRTSTAAGLKKLVIEQYEKIQPGYVFETSHDPEAKQNCDPYTVVVLELLVDTYRLQVFCKDYQQGKELKILKLSIIHLQKMLPSLTTQTPMCKAARKWFTEHENSLTTTLHNYFVHEFTSTPSRKVIKGLATLIKSYLPETEMKLDPGNKSTDEIFISDRTEKDAWKNFTKLLTYTLEGRPLAAGFAYDLSVCFDVCYSLNQIGALASKYCSLVLQETSKRFKHELSVSLKCVMQKKSDGSTFVGMAHFPARGFLKIWQHKDVERFLSTFEGRFDMLTSGDDQAFPELFGDTDNIFQRIDRAIFQVSKQYTAGCTGTCPTKLGRGVLWNPANKDNLCLWRCLAKKLYEWKHKNIRVGTSRYQRNLAKFLLQHTRKTLPELSPDGTVALNQIASVADALQLDIRVCSRNKNNSREMLYPKFDFDNSRSGHPGLKDIDDAKCSQDPIYFHYQSSGSGHGHFVLINKMNAYVTQFECDICKVQWVVQKAGGEQYKRYRKHMEKHKRGKNPNETQLKFNADRCVEPTIYAFEKHLSVNLRHNCYFVFDFEALTTKYNSANEAEIISKHDPIAFVLKFVNCFQDKPEFECAVEYCGDDPSCALVDHLTNIHDKLKRYLTVKFWQQHGKQVNALKDYLCNCTPMLHHRHTCPKKPGLVEQAKRLGIVGCCKVRETHANKSACVKEDLCMVYVTVKELSDDATAISLQQEIQSFLPKTGKCKFQTTLNALKRQYLNIPIYGFNSGKYDMTFVIKAMGRTKWPQLGTVISKSSGFMKVDFGIYSFLDMWLLGTPDTSLQKAGKQWGVKAVKGHFPYAWFNDKNKLNYKGLPPRECWYNDMRKQDLAETDYRALQNEFKQEGMTCFQEYMMKYCRLDVEVLAQVVLKYREMVWKEYKLDLCNYLSIGQLSMQNWLTQRQRSDEHKKYPLPYIADEMCYQVIMKSLFGGRTEVFRQHLQATGDSVGMSLDMSNLYGHSMQGHLLYGPMEFRNERKECATILEKFRSVSSQQHKNEWHNRWSFQTLHWNDLCSYNSKLDREKPPADPYEHDGIFEVRISFTPAQKERMKEFPPLGEHAPPPEKEFTPFMKNKLKRRRKIIKEKTGVEPHRQRSVKKLMFTLHDKEDYCIDGFALKYLLEHDMCTLDVVYSWVKMSRGYAVRRYIDKITEQRSLAEKEIFETEQELKEQPSAALQTKLAGAKARKGFYKLINCSLSGKMYQSDEKYGQSALVTNHKQYNTATNGRLVLDRTIISNDLVEVRMRKDEALIKSPRYLASSLLWLSKIKMLDFYYNQLTRVHTDNIEIYATDTDSIKFKVSHLLLDTLEDIYMCFLESFKDYRIVDCNGTQYSLYDLGFQKDGEIIPGKMKLEELFTEGIYLKPKLYAQCNAESNKAEFHAKGVKLYQNPDLQSIDTYRSVLEHESVEFGSNMNIQKTKKLGSVENITMVQNKVALDSYDNKRKWLGHNVSEPFGMLPPHTRPLRERIERNLCGRIQKYVHISNDQILHYLGCTTQQAMDHLESQWYKCDVNVCWQNYGARWQIDHIAPVSLLKGDASQAMLKKLCNYKNLQPLSASQNASKKDKLSKEALQYLNE